MRPSGKLEGAPRPQVPEKTMLSELRLENFAIIDDISVGFGDGLNIITGETGTGKSLIVDAINVILGDRFTTDHAKSPGREVVVEALFEIPPGCGIAEKLEKFGVGSGGDELVVKRVLTERGRSRIYANGSMIALGVLSELTGGLVNMFGQHEHQNLLRKSNYLNYLDDFSQLEHELSEYGNAYAELSEIGRRIEALEKKRLEGTEKRDYLGFQIEEIRNVSPAEGEDSKLEEERTRLENSEKFSSSLGGAAGLLYEREGSAVDSLKQAASRLEEVSGLDSSLGKLRDRINSLLIEAEDVFYGLNEFAGRVEHNPARLEEVISRLEDIKKLKRKHGDSIGEILEKLRRMETELGEMDNSDELFRELGKKRDSLRGEVFRAAESISSARQAGAGRLEELFAVEAESVGLKNARFEIEFGEKELSADGRDRVDFLFSANPGQKPRPVTKVASGGELSRIMLALRSFVSAGDPGSILIFDEADAGIGGVVAETIGRKIKELSAENQVICITHLPQVAKFADTHLLVAKNFGEGETEVSVDVMTGRRRVEEISRMLAGQSVSEKTFEVAEELIKGAS